VLKEIRALHPTVDTLIPAARDELDGLRAFVLDHHIATIPSDLLPKVEETRVSSARRQRPHWTLQVLWSDARRKPPTTSRHLMTGPRQTSSNNISKPITSPGSRSYRRMRFGRAISCSIERAAPIPTDRARQMADAYSTTEGWAHYAEQMMVEQGLGVVTRN
jgi:hypothetical protein